MRYDWIYSYVRVWYHPDAGAPYFREGQFRLPEDQDRMEQWVNKTTREYLKKIEDGEVKVEYFQTRPRRRYMKGSRLYSKEKPT